MIETGYYKHYKGDCYMVVGEGIHTETNEELVSYHNINNPFKLYFRPKTHFLGMVGDIQRFTLIRPITVHHIDYVEAMYEPSIEINKKESLWSRVFGG
jgi:hypothetical protein